MRQSGNRFSDQSMRKIKKRITIQPDQDTL